MKRQFLLLLSTLMTACAFATSTSTSSSDVRDCANVSGRFLFYGDWSQPLVASLKGESLTDSRQEGSPRIDESAFGFVVRTITNPHFAVVEQDVMTGIAKIDVSGSDFDARFTKMSAKLPFTSALKCVDGSWVIESTVEGKSGGFRPTETKTRIALRLTEDGHLIATGEKQITTGSLSRTTVSQNWKAIFRKRLHDIKSSQDK